jgi:hypothetical protein
LALGVLQALSALCADRKQQVTKWFPTALAPHIDVNDPPLALAVLRLFAPSSTTVEINECAEVIGPRLGLQGEVVRAFAVGQCRSSLADMRATMGPVAKLLNVPVNMCAALVHAVSQPPPVCAFDARLQIEAIVALAKDLVSGKKFEPRLRKQQENLLDDLGDVAGGTWPLKLRQLHLTVFNLEADSSYQVSGRPYLTDGSHPVDDPSRCTRPLLRHADYRTARAPGHRQPTFDTTAVLH